MTESESYTLSYREILLCNYFTCNCHCSTWHLTNCSGAFAALSMWEELKNMISVTIININNRSWAITSWAPTQESVRFVISEHLQGCMAFYVLQLNTLKRYYWVLDVMTKDLLKGQRFCRGSSLAVPKTNVKLAHFHIRTASDNASRSTVVFPSVWFLHLIWIPKLFLTNLKKTYCCAQGFYFSNQIKSKLICHVHRTKQL